jgi:iron complex outermembrane receptor protein
MQDREKTVRYRELFLCHVAFGIGFAAPACAQVASPAANNGGGQPVTPKAAQGPQRLEEIVVTAQRKSENLQKVPIAITAVSGRQLQAHGETDTLSLIDSVPNLTLNEGGTIVSPYLRGVGTNGSNPNDEQSVATYIDGVYIGSPIGNVFTFNDIDRIEVLKGPQGTLFGRNATGGVIQVITRDPSQTASGQVSVGYGNYDTIYSSLYATGGITPNLAGSVAAVINDNLNGYGKDIGTGKDTYRRDDTGVRAKLKWTPSDRTIVRLEADYEHVRSDGSPYQVVPGNAAVNGVFYNPGPYNTDTNWPNSTNTEVFGTSLHVDQDLDFARLVSISAFRNTSELYYLDEDSSPFPLVNSHLHSQGQTVSQELQLLSQKDSTLQWVVGAYYYNARYTYAPFYLSGLAAEAPPQFGGFGLPYVDIDGEQRTNSGSIYGQATYPIFADTHFTAGLRYTAEYASDRGSVHYADLTLLDVPIRTNRFERLTWRFALDHQFTDAITGYISDNRGIKSGGYNLLGPGSPGYFPEVLDAYEIGLKSRFLHDTLQLNGAGFYYSYSNIQVETIKEGAVDTLNAAAATLKGFDMDARLLPYENVTLSAGLGYTDGYYSNFPNSPKTPPSPIDGPQTTEDATGHQLVNAARWTANGSADYTIPTEYGNFLTDVTFTYRSKTYVASDERLYIPAFTVVNASVSWTSPNNLYKVQGWVHNLGNTVYYAARTETTVGDLQTFAPPRTYGFTLTRNF